ncbi:MAG TPA: DUF4286 family protein [Phycisphaerales bacterium]
MSPEVEIAYSVTATLPDSATALEYVGWLCGGHIQAVIAGGASTASVSRLSDPRTTIEVEARYLFPNREAFDKYVAEVAPALRAEGLARFGNRVRFSRRVAEVVGSA